jgi:glycosyltransferase involved in cell wall biosynthesis
MRMKVAIVHYWFLVPGGGEQVIESLTRLYPQADIFCLFADERRLPAGVSRARVKASLLDRMPFAHRLNRMFFPLYSAAAGSFDLSGYDLILSSDSPPIKGVVTSSEAVHISYCHTPGRYIWDMSASFMAKLPWFARPIFAEMASNARIADYVAAQRVDHFIANSNYVARRIHKYYGRKSTVIYPPVNVAKGYLADSHDDYYLSVGRLVQNKRLDILIEACNLLQRRLVIVGEGRNEKHLRTIAGPTIEFRGRVSSEELGELYARCRAFLFAADEDFGIVSVEAQSYGRPVIAFGRGGSLETVRVGDEDGRPDTGLFFSAQNAEAVKEALLGFEAREGEYVPSEMREHSLKFDAGLFEEKIAAFVDSAMATKDAYAASVISMPVRSFAAAPWDGVERRGKQFNLRPRLEPLSMAAPSAQGYMAGEDRSGVGDGLPSAKRAGAEPL